MIGIKKNTEYLDLLPGTQIQRERESPVFLTQTESGKDGIPGEVSYPFTIPLTDKNLRLLKHPDSLPQAKELEHDIVLENAGMQLSAGKLVIESIQGHLVKNNVGVAEGYILSNVSEFWSRVRDKKLSDLTLGGDRTFTWAGYSTTTAGFWKHVHDTWAYDNADDGDYVFFPVACLDWKEEDQWHIMNKWDEFSGTLQMARDYNLTSLCPHPYLVYIIRQVFLEHGYEIEGDILNDPDFKQLCLISYRGVRWANEGLDLTAYPDRVPTAIPLSSQTIRLYEHVPPETTIGEFLVELQKFLPITFVINDTQRRCRVVSSEQITGVGAKNRDSQFNPNFTLEFDVIDKSEAKVIGLSRAYDDEFPVLIDPSEYNYIGEVQHITDLPTAGSSNADHVYLVRDINRYVQNKKGLIAVGSPEWNWVDIGDNLGNLERDQETDTIEQNITPLGMDKALIFTGTVNGQQIGYVPVTRRQGNWYKPWVLQPQYRETTPWGMRVMFYRGLQMFNQIQAMPFATNHIWAVNSHETPQTSYTQVGNWSLAFQANGFGLYEVFWSKWLPTLETGERIKGTLYLKLHEYLNWDWDKVLLIQNTPYLIKKIEEVLPYPGRIDIEAVRLPS